MRIFVLDMKNHVTENVSRHQVTVNSSVLRTSETYCPAVCPNSPGTLICYNHPSGDSMPLPEDIAVTEQLVQAGRHLDIELVDHLVIGNQRYVSLKERMKW
jgi:DNA repair protein RadC